MDTSVKTTLSGPVEDVIAAWSLPDFVFSDCQIWRQITSYEAYCTALLRLKWKNFLYPEQC